MASAFPHRPPIDHSPREEADITVRGNLQSTVMQAMASETAQKILSALGEEPGTVSDIAEAVDTSMQNVQYHLERLRDAELVERVGTWYSSRGTPMTVYALASERLVVRFGDDEPSDCSGEVAD